MKPLLSILMLFLGMAAACVASPEQFVFESLPDASGPGTNAAAAGISTNTPPLTNLVVVDEMIKDLPPPTNLPPTPPALQSAPKAAPVEPAGTPEETESTLPALIPSSKVAPVRIEPAVPPEAEAVSPEESNPVVQAPPTNNLPPVNPPVVETNPPPVLPLPQVAPQSSTPPAVQTGVPAETSVAVQAPVHTNAPPAAKTKTKRQQFVFAPLPTAPDAHPDLTVHYDAVKDVIAAPAHVGDPEPARPAVEKKPLQPGASGARLIVSPSHEFYGTVAAVDPHGRFVVLNFPLGQMPAVDTVLPVFRHGVNVGQIKITGPQRDDNTAADVISGDLQVDDDVRD
jgi:hypothetical protein